MFRPTSSSIQIVQNDRETRSPLRLKVVSALETIPQRYKTRSPYPDSSLPSSSSFFFSRVAACNQPKFRESILDALTHPPMHPSLATGPFDFRNFRLIVFEALLPGSRGHFHFLAPEIFHFHRRPRLGGNRDGGGGLSTLFPEGLELVRWIWFEFRGNCDRMIIR